MNALLNLFTFMLDRRSLIADTIPALSNSQFTLDTSGVAGIFGGDEAVSAMATVHVYESRRWLGWYNNPGSYLIAKRYGLLAGSRFFNGVFPGVHTDPATLFELDGWTGPKFRATQSGTLIEQTGHIASLIMKEAASKEGEVIRGRTTTPIGITIVDLNHVPEPRIHPKRINAYSPIFASVPIAASIGTCVACAVLGDWFCFVLILLGIIAGGVSCLVIGSGKFVFSHPEPANGSPDGDGILGSDTEVVLLRGPEGAVNCITRGKFSLYFASEPQYNNIGWCSLLLTLQFIVQLLLIPQGSLFGQIMFVVSLGVSWVYNSWLSSLDKEKIQRKILLNSVLGKPKLTKFILGTRTSMVVFTLFVLKPQEPSKILDELLPNDTRVWRKFKETVVQQIQNEEKVQFSFTDSDLIGFTPQERKLLETLCSDAQAAYDGFSRYSPKLKQST